jgi:GT2 family glycosyltransferase
LAHRLQIAADSGADYAYAMNHDSQFHPEVVSKLADACSADPSLGAAYPLSLFTSVGRYNLTGTRELPLSRKLVRNVNEQPLIDVFWSSSNGAIYSLDPIRKGILPWDAMWMGWEDLDYGWRLFDHGYRQVIVRDAVFKDNNEYTQTNLGSVTDKPPWRTYYLMRNLILAVRRSRNRPLYHAVTAYRAFLEASLILGIRKNKAERLRLLTRGIIDGIRGVTGQVPSL